MLFFAHTHLTVTVTVGLLLIPKVFESPSFFSFSKTEADKCSAEAILYKIATDRIGKDLSMLPKMQVVGVFFNFKNSYTFSKILTSSFQNSRSSKYLKF